MSRSNANTQHSHVWTHRPRQSIRFVILAKIVIDNMAVDPASTKYYKFEFLRYRCHSVVCMAITKCNIMSFFLQNVICTSDIFDT